MQLLNQFLKQQEVEDQLIDLIGTLMLACKEVALQLREGALSGVLGSTENTNIQGETQKKMDVIANDLMKKFLLDNPLVAGIASEEEEHPVAGNSDGRYLVIFDPLDGSSNIDINVSVGTIFSILERPRDLAVNQDEAYLQCGRKQIASGYVLYGQSSILALTTGNGVNFFTLAHTGDFILTREQVKIPESTAEFAINMSNYKFWEDEMRTYIDELLKGQSGARQKNYNMRWVASMVAEVHRVLTRGGIFTYPWDRRNPEKPGKLRLMYEGNPMSLLVEQAGGVSTTCYKDILDLEPKYIHQRCSVALGSTDEVTCLVSYHADSTQGQSAKLNS